MNPKFLIGAFLLVALLFLVLLYNPKKVENKRENTNLVVTQSRLAERSSESEVKLSEKLEELDYDVVLESNMDSEDAVELGDTVRVTYRGWRASDGFLFDESFKRGDEGLSFTVGSGVIDGWSEGVIGMKLGEVRRLKIPSNLGYAEIGSGDDIPPDTDLIFEIELLEIVSKGS